MTKAELIAALAELGDDEEVFVSDAEMNVWPIESVGVVRDVVATEPFGIISIN